MPRAIPLHISSITATGTIQASTVGSQVDSRTRR
jgi:hypothetical protein